jgi:hypothetical protein
MSMAAKVRGCFQAGIWSPTVRVGAFLDSVFEDQSPSPEFVPDHVVAGDWALVAGVSFMIIGLALVAMRSRGRQFGALIALGWLVALAALACGIAMLVAFLDQPNGPDGPSIEIGAAIAAATPVVAVLGLAVVQTACARERAVRLELARG